MAKAKTKYDKIAFVASEVPEAQEMAQALLKEKSEQEGKAPC